MLKVGVYILHYDRTGEFYVGSSGNLDKRIEQHLSALNAGRHHCARLQSLWTKDSRLRVTFFPAMNRDEAYELEQDFLDRYKNLPLLLNIVLQARGGDTLTRDPNREERIRRMKEIMLSRMAELTKEEKVLLFGRSGTQNGMWGKTHSDEVKSQLSKIHKGNDYNLGAVFTQEHRRKISENAAKRVGELNSFYGKVHSEETKKRISEAKKAQGLLPPNTRKVEVNGIQYESLTDAARRLDISPALVIYRINSSKDKYSGYCYCA